MISFLEMAQQYPIGSKVTIPGEGDGGSKREIVGYEYYNGTGYLVFRDNGKIEAERLSGQ